MAIDRYEDLPGIISELQDGGLQIFEENSAPAVLVLGTAAQGTSDAVVQVTRAQEIENRFGKTGTLVRGMYEVLQGGSTNVNVQRIGARSAILFGVGTDDMNSDPSSIETLLKDQDASKLYFLRYVSPASRGPNEDVGHLKIKNAVGQVVYDNNPGGQMIDTGEVLVSGDFEGGIDIGNPLNSEDFVSFEEAAKDKVEQEDLFTAISPAPASYSLSQVPNAGTVVVTVDGEEIAAADFSLAGQTLTLSTPSEEEVVVSYEYDSEEALNIRFGSDGVALSKMELYEALSEAYKSIETEEYAMVVPMGVELDTKNVKDGDTVVLASDARIQVGRRFPVPGSKGDALGTLFVEEYDGEFFYFWDINNDGVAEIYPSIGAASATTKIDGSALQVGDFKEVNFAHQLAQYCYTASANEYNVLGVIGTSLPASFAPKDVSKWIGKEPTFDADSNMIVNGTGLLGNKIMVGKVNHKAGLFATSNDIYQGASGSTGGNIEKDRGGRPVDMGRYISVYSAPQTFFNSVDETGFGYHANGAAYYAGFITSLAPQSSPSNKIAPDAVSPLKLSKAKLNSLAKFGFVSLKQKNRVLRFSDAPTAARKASDFQRLTTMRVVNDVIDDIRTIAAPYIGEANTSASRKSLETNINVLLGKKQEAGVIQRFEAKVSATTKQRIEGDMTVELILVPPFEVRKIEVVTSLAKE
ncbi:MAG: hypothetical protein PHY47_00390 [Lachnospiraceae bacterium]|nr:hypothetical protein [Lachnospiraceae bacterium]